MTLVDLPTTTLVIPCYNEAARLNFTAFAEALERFPLLTLLWVNDGSTDQTAQLLERFCSQWPERSTWLDLKVNQGKAEAVRTGVLAACAARPVEYVGFWDADLATPLDQWPVLASAGPASILMGCRLARLGAQVERRAVRHYLGRVFATVVSLVLGVRVYDSQCGAKLLHRKVVPQLMSSGFLSRWLFDVEILLRLQKHSPLKNCVIEVPLLRWTEVGGSKLRLKDAVRAPWELWRLFARYKLGRQKD